MIRFDAVSKNYGPDRKVVDDLTLAIAEGEICMLVGPSGCGKTTTMKMINRLVEPDKGTVLVGGRPVRSVDPIRLRLNIGYVIQEIGLFPHMSVADNIATVPIELGWPKGRIAARIDELLDCVDEPKKRLLLCAMALDMSKADAEFSELEMAIFTHMLDRWHLTLEDIQTAFADE